MKKRKLDIWIVISLVIAAVYALFLIYPLLILLFKAIIDPVSRNITFSNFTKFFSEGYYTKSLMNSFIVSSLGTLTALIVGIPLAYCFSAYKFKGKSVLRLLIILSSMSAPFIGAYSWILLLGRNGVLTKFITQIFPSFKFEIYGFAGILLVFTVQLFPLIFLYTEGALSNVDNSLLEASENMGVKGIKRFFKVIIPLIMPTILAGALLVFMRALADFGTPMLIGEGYRTFPVLIFEEFINEVGGNDGFASAIAIISILITTVVFLVQKYLSNKYAFSMSALRPIIERKVVGVKKFVVYLFSYGIVAVAIMPQLYVLYTSFLETKGMVFQNGLSLKSYEVAFTKLGGTLLNTVLIPAIALIIIVFLSVLIAYITVRKRNALSSSIDVVSMIPYIVPGTVVGIALLVSFNKKPLLLSGTLAIMVISLVIRRLPYTIRSSVATLQQIPLSMEEAATSLGASKMKTFFKVTMPMMKAGIMSGAILSWVTMISELSTAIILYNARTQTLTVAMYTEVIRGNYGIAAALSGILTVITTISLIFFLKVSKGKRMGI